MIAALLLTCCLGGSSVPLFSAPPHSGSTAVKRSGYAPTVHGQVAGYRLAGIEPDGDPLDQVVLRTKLSPSAGVPPLNLIVSSYLENFKPDTTPILPDLLHPNRTAQQLGGFLQGKALLTDDAGEVLYIGSFLAEAFLDNSNHGVMELDGTGSAEHGTVKLKGIFRLQKDGSLAGSFTGRISLPAAARRQLIEQQGKIMRPLTEILKTVTVVPAPMRGKATTGSPNAPLHTGFGSPSAGTPPAKRTLSIWTIVTGVGAVVCFLLAGVLFWSSRRGQGDRTTTVSKS